MNPKILTEKEIIDFFKKYNIGINPIYDLDLDKKNLIISHNPWGDIKLSSKFFSDLTKFLETDNFHILFECSTFEFENTTVIIKIIISRKYVDLKEEEDENDY